MYTEHTINGIEASSFWEYWHRIKARIRELIDLGPRIRQQWERAKAIWQRETSPQRKVQALQSVERWAAMYATWQEIKARLDRWLPTWMKIEQEGASTSEGTVGVIPLVLPAWALATLIGGGLAALTFVATKGLELLEQYRTESAILDQIERGVVTPEAGAQLLTTVRPASKPLIEVGTGMGIMALVAGALGIWWVWGRR